MAIKNYVYALMTDRRQGIMDVVVKGFLWILSLVYGLIVRGTHALYAWKVLPSYRSPKPVISIGNITVGGAGKTPLTIAVVQALGARQKRVAVLSRGYMAGQNAEFSDEAKMLGEHLQGVSVLTGANRRVSIEAFLANHVVDAFICDDAFQHWPLQRDLDIVAIDTRNPFGNGCLVPRGILREKKSSLRRAQIIVLTKTGHPHANTEQLRANLSQINPNALIVESKHTCVGCVHVFQRTAYDHIHLKGLSVVAFCGIADPESFRHTLQEAGLNVANLFVFMDHHVYTQEDMAMIRRWAIDHDIQIIMTTHKDAVKLQFFEEFWQGFRVYYMQVELEITQGKNVFIERVLSAVHR